MGLRQSLAALLGGGGQTKATPEGQPHGPPYTLPITGGWLGAEGNAWNWWQNGYDVRPNARTAMVEACVAAYAQTVAMLPGNHWRLEGDGGRVRVTTSALTRWLRKPNAYQSISDFLLNTVARVFNEGEAFALAIRNDRFEIAEYHIMRRGHPLIAEDGSVFYELSGNEVVDRMIAGRIIAPARDVLHVRFLTPEHPLKGETPITTAALSMAASNAALASQVAFFRNQSRPSTVLSTDLILTKEQVGEIRERWDEQSKGLATGGTPILTAGLKPVSLGVNAQDAALIQLLEMSDKTIATAFRVPHVMVGLGQSPMASTEALMQFWLASGLGFVLNHMEEALGLAFGLKGQPEEYLELDTGALLRPAFKDRVEGLVKATLGGLLSPDEGRGELERGKVPGGWGAEPRVQQQVVPLSAWKLLEAKLAKPDPTKPVPGEDEPADLEDEEAPPGDGEEPAEDEDTEEPPNERAYDEPDPSQVENLHATLDSYLSR